MELGRILRELEKGKSRGGGEGFERVRKKLCCNLIVLKRKLEERGRGLKGREGEIIRGKCWSWVGLGFEV